MTGFLRKMKGVKALSLSRINSKIKKKKMPGRYLETAKSESLSLAES